ncbi:MAG: MBL fold metallo-hydrolase [Flavobacteriales bacterium]|nr:MBL fold metallo-hydrolase [Flavobacteriales bacterium]
MHIHSFEFGPFAENTYVLSDPETQMAIVVDPGCSNPHEEQELKDWIESQNITIANVLLTHAHVDHVMGCRFVCDAFKVGITMHKEDLFLLEKGPQIGMMYGFPVKEAPAPEHFLSPGDIFTFGQVELQVLFTPGHSPGSISFVHTSSKSIFSGDVLFKGSIGRTDLPGGSFDVLINSIKSQLFVYDDDYKVYSGHGGVTTLGEERRFNPFLK